MAAIHPDIRRMLDANHGTITTSQVLSLGFSRQLLTKYVRSGALERIRQGVYILPGAVHDDMYTLMLRSRYIIFSHETALFLNGLSDRTPFIHSVTLPSNAAIPGSIREECLCFYCRPELHGLGATERQNSFGHTVRCYDAERTICDLLRTRKRCDEETVISALKNYAAYADKDLNRLAAYAARLKVLPVLQRYMEVLL